MKFVSHHISFLLLAFAVEGNCAEPTWNIVAREAAGQQMTIELHYDPAAPSDTIGRFSTGGKGSCRGTLTFSGLTRQKDLRFDQQIESGRCEQDCKLILSATFDKYKEVCRKRATAVQPLVLERGDVTRDQVVAVQNAPKSNYGPSDFKGVQTWVKAFDKMANDPKGFRDMLTKMARDAGSGNAIAFGLVGGGKRNYIQQLLSDVQLYALYEPKPAVLLEKSKECTALRPYTPKEACDCTAAFPGESPLGAGAGELVVQSNVKLIVDACAKAVADASTPSEKARYLAQRARGQIKRNDQSIAVPWIDESVALGFKRALILKAQATLFEIEERSGGFPPPSDNDYAQLIKFVTQHLERAKREGVRETYIVGTQVEQVFSRLKLNSAILSPIYREMTKPPADAKCEPRYGKIGEYSDGKPMVGMIDNCYANPFLR